MSHVVRKPVLLHMQMKQQRHRSAYESVQSDLHGLDNNNTYTYQNSKFLNPS